MQQVLQVLVYGGFVDRSTMSLTARLVMYNSAAETFGITTVSAARLNKVTLRLPFHDPPLFVTGTVSVHTRADGDTSSSRRALMCSEVYHCPAACV